MKKLSCLLLTIVLTFNALWNVSALTDEFIFTDPVTNTYTGRREAGDMITNFDFKDVENLDYKTRESIVRMGALNMVKPYTENYKPNTPVSNQEVLAFVLRAIGQENLAQSTGVVIQQAFMPDNFETRDLWSLGYLNLALQRGLITQAQYTDALADQTILDPAVNFMRSEGAIREQVADWLYRGLLSAYATLFNTTEVQHAIYDFPDWEQIAPNKVAAVEALAANGIMGADASGKFSPKKYLTRAEMAVILKNMDNIYYTAAGIVKKTGTVGGIKDAQTNSTGNASVTRNIYIRTQDGTIDVIQYSNSQSSSPQPSERDAVVYKDDNVTGLAALKENDQIEYLTNTLANTILYVQVVNSAMDIRHVQGILKSVDVTKGVINITDADGKDFAYPLVKGLYGIDPTSDTASSYLLMDNRRRNVKELPIGSRIELRILNNIVDEIKYIGETAVILEMRGIVIENNPDFGYIMFIDNNGNEQIKNYTSGDIRVKKQEYYETENKIGYLDQVFPNFKFNPNDSRITEIEPGDIIFLQLDPDDQDIITAISASTNYLLRYGKIRTYKINGDTISLVVEYENKQTASFDVSANIYMSRDGKPIKAADVKVGDWTKLLINQAIIQGGQLMESVKEITIEGAEHFISKIIKGKLSNVNSVQNLLTISKAYTLGNNGWGFPQDLKQFSLKGRDIEYYYNDTRITLDYAVKYLKRADGDVYVALESGLNGETVKKVTFRDQFDQLMKPDSVVDANGSSNFTTSVGGHITYDSGTIVRRYGRLVDGKDVSLSDYAVVSLNGNAHAAVVDITPMPDVSGILIVRGRVIDVDDAVSFKVSSTARLVDNAWNVANFFPTEYTINSNTIYLDAVGSVPLQQFIDYESTSVYNKVFNMVIVGGSAVRIVDAPYANSYIRGTIYEVIDNGTGGGMVRIKDATYRTAPGSQPLPVSNANRMATVDIPINSIVVRNNEVVNMSTLKVGEQISAMTILPTTISSGVIVPGYVVLVEK